MRLSNLLGVVLLFLFASAVYAQPGQPKQPPLNPRVNIKKAALPSWLKAKFARRAVLDAGVTPFGTNQKDVWVVCYQEKKSLNPYPFVELWEQGAKNRPQRLLHTEVPYSADRPLSSEFSPLQLFWLFPAQHNGPVIAVNLDSQHKIYTFAKGWSDPKPIIQNVAYLSGETLAGPFRFYSVDNRNIAQGLVFVFYHMTSPEDEPGGTYALWWHRGQGWFASNDKDKPES